MGVTITAKMSCSRCGGPRDGNQYYCRPCARIYTQEWRKRHPEYDEGRKVYKNGHPKFVGPSWLCPTSIPQIFATISASIVWGLCGHMEDSNA